MHVQMLKSKLHQACVTQSDVYYEGSLGIDIELMEAVGLHNHEKILVSNINNEPKNGENFHQYAGVFRETAELDRRIGLLTAREMALRAVELDPKNSQWQLSAARLEIELGGLAEAGARLDTILESDPSNAEALQLKQRLKTPAPPAAQP